MRGSIPRKWERRKTVRLAKSGFGTRPAATTFY